MKDYEIIAIEDVRKLEEKMNFKFQRQDLPFENTQHGITQLQNGFFNLLKDFILILPDASIQEVCLMYSDDGSVNRERQLKQIQNLISGPVPLRNHRNNFDYGQSSRSRCSSIHCEAAS